MKSHVLKIISIFILILGIIGSIAYGVIYQNELDNLTEYVTGNTFFTGFTVALIGIISTLLLFTILLTASAMLEHLENVDNGLNQLINKEHNHLQNNQPAPNTNLESNQNTGVINREVVLKQNTYNKSTEKWTCNNCGEINPPDSRFCSKCGSWKQT